VKDLIKIVENRVGSKIIYSKAIQFVSKKVAPTSVDARKVLEITSIAVAECLESLSPEERNDTKLEKPIVSLKFMLRHQRIQQNMQMQSSTCRHWGKLSSVLQSR
jgi:Cdc6-like AAA superfamily ATPase